MSDTLPQTPRTKANRAPKRVDYDRQVIDAILDEAPLCHIGLVVDGGPIVVPTVHWRVGDELMVHGAGRGRVAEALTAGAEACVTVSLIDAWVLARSAFHHSVNYRSVMLFGAARLLTDEVEKRAALDALVEKIQPGRSKEARPANAAELKSTAVHAFKITEASAKVRSGPPEDGKSDLELPVWAGIIPLTLVRGEPVACG